MRAKVNQERKKGGHYSLLRVNRGEQKLDQKEA